MVPVGYVFSIPYHTSKFFLFLYLNPHNIARFWKACSSKSRVRTWTYGTYSCPKCIFSFVAKKTEDPGPGPKTGRNPVLRGPNPAESHQEGPVPVRRRESHQGDPDPVESHLADLDPIPEEKDPEGPVLVPEGRSRDGTLLVTGTVPTLP